MITGNNLTYQLEELRLVRCSLLPGELFTFLLPPEDTAAWTRLLEALPANPEDEAPTEAHFAVKLEHVPVWFEVELPRAYPEATSPVVAVKAGDVSRIEQERWQAVVREKMEELEGSELEYPIYQLISLHLLPLLHVDLENSSQASCVVVPSVTSSSDPNYHALLTSHHLVSPAKRRSLQQWSSTLFLSGFAKLGHPGVIYAAGARSHVEQFVSDVKAMQWLALRVRFVEPVDERQEQGGEGGWKELQKVGEVVEEMRRIGREEYVLEMGIGSAGASK